MGRAQSVLETATQIDPGHARAFAALGMAMSDQRKYGAAIAPLENALKIDPAIGWDAEWTLAKAYYQTARYEDALKMSQAALDAVEREGAADCVAGGAVSDGGGEVWRCGSDVARICEGAFGSGGSCDGAAVVAEVAESRGEEAMK